MGAGCSASLAPQEKTIGLRPAVTVEEGFLGGLELEGYNQGFESAIGAITGILKHLRCV